MELVLASNNKGKIAEIRTLLPHINILTLQDIGYTTPIEEPFDTFRENAHAKASVIHLATGRPVLSDDSGLSVDALNGAPGVYSARYAGPDATDAANNQKLLDALKGQSNRAGHYTAVLCLITHSGPAYFEGKCHGHIALEPAGTGGFGYDPLFIPDGYTQTFGQMDPLIKKKISHRAKALEQLVASLYSHLK